jgi:hypothetical protein
MFMRYTPFGIGHPLTLRKITRDCLGPLAAPAAGSDAMDTTIVDDVGHEDGVSDGEDGEECNDEREEDPDDELSDDWEELESEDGEDRDGDEDTFDDLSF